MKTVQSSGSSYFIGLESIEAVCIWQINKHLLE